jgi:hypothetical protein
VHRNLEGEIAAPTDKHSHHANDLRVMTSRHCFLIQALSRNADKFNPPSDDSRWSSRISDLRQRFEIQLLAFLHRGLTLRDSQSLPREEARELESRVEKLCNYLDKVSNITFEAGKPRKVFPTPPLGTQAICPRLNHVITLLDEVRGPVDLSGPTHSAVFQLTDVEATRRALTLVKRVNEFLNQVQQNGAVHIKPITLNHSSRSTIAFNASIQSFADASIERLGKLLDTIALEFDACTPQTSEAMHGFRTKLLNYEIENANPQETLDLCLYCPSLNDWQVTRCEFETYVIVDHQMALVSNKFTESFTVA